MPGNAYSCGANKLDVQALISPARPSDELPVPLRAMPDQSMLVACTVFIYIDKLQFKGSWSELKGKRKQHYGNPTDDGLTCPEGKENSSGGFRRSWARAKTNCER